MVESGIGAEASRDRVSEGLLEEVALSQDLGGEQEPVWEDRGVGYLAVGTAGPEGRREARGSLAHSRKTLQGAGVDVQASRPTGLCRSRRSWDSVMHAKASVGGLLKNCCAGMICHRSNMILFITFSK